MQITTTVTPSNAVFRAPAHAWVLAAGSAALLLFTFRTGLGRMVTTWFDLPEYSHGILIPLISLFLVWQRKDEIERLQFTDSWAGVALVAAGAMLFVVGQLATLYVAQQYALLLVLYGLVLSCTGWTVFRRLLVPLALLMFMIPLPQFLLANASAQLQLLSSQIGVAFIRLFDISVNLEGNVIDLGSYQLQVAEACDGLRYLFPLMTLALVMAYFFKAPLWQRALVFASSIPITVLMNSLRIGVIGLMVDRWGVRMAEGFMHDFQGWVVFMISAGILLLEMLALTRLSGNRQAWREVYGLEFPARSPSGAQRLRRSVPVTFIVALGLLLVVAVLVTTMPAREEVVPRRAAFAGFPTRIDGWIGRRDTLDRQFLDVLKLEDYVLMDFMRPPAGPVSLYVAWYDTQGAGESAHSPRSCIPGGGWQIVEFSEIAVPGVTVAGKPLRANRVLIRSGSQSHLVYYWFQQRGRIVTNEYLVKWYLLTDSLRLHRTDGALVRLTTPVVGGDTLRAERALRDFARSAVPELASYVPD